MYRHNEFQKKGEEMRPRRYPYSRIKRKSTMNAGNISATNLSVGSIDEKQLQKTIEKLKKLMGC